MKHRANSNIWELHCEVKRGYVTVEYSHLKTCGLKGTMSSTGNVSHGHGEFRSKVQSGQISLISSLQLNHCPSIQNSVRHHSVYSCVICAHNTYFYDAQGYKWKTHWDYSGKNCSHMSISSRGCVMDGGAETAWVNKDYVTGALMSFSSKQLLPPFHYLIKLFHLQQIQQHAPLDRWQREDITSARMWRVRGHFWYPVCSSDASSHYVSRRVQGLTGVCYSSAPFGFRLISLLWFIIVILCKAPVIQ